ncbi:hypothetical protein Ait01nite_043070 [Actinoplanes italicus]|uniref:HEAT repeat protein n=1 Tax=Actinoplanes italicus TaxID=113567 RepID=A0A2T0KC36_9ACTN|nr:DUF6493 family protein [Actinoplanes italicus]PRX20787.1 hypothetical protein CLV67_10764 [Actinoplanes italicus]GIE31262.1 hypothetical protein Ait01nite_043070 [Actinoplanes italicus]
MRLDWEMLDVRARSGNHTGVARLLLQAGEEERLAFGKAVEAGIKGAGPDVWWRSHTNPAPGYALAVIGTARSAAKAASLLRHRSLRAQWREIPMDRFLALAQARRLDWLGDLGTRLSRPTPTGSDWDNGEWAFTAAIMRAGGVEPPVTEGVTRFWLLRLLQPYGGHGRERPPLNVRLRDDPYLDLLLPAVFDIDTLGTAVTHSSWGEPEGRLTAAHHFPAAVASLVAEGRLQRKVVLAATIDRLVRGDTPNALRPFLQLHDELDPTADEIAAHALGYARMLAEGPGPVAALSQRVLRVLDDTGRLDVETLLDTSSAVLLRKEKTMVKVQISWLERVAGREPGRAGEVFETIAVAFGHPALDVQERALVLIGRQLPHLGPDVVARLADASRVLAGDLPARAAELFGGIVPVTGPAGVPSLPPPVESAPMPPPVANAPELAEEVVALLHDQSGVRWERVLAGLVALHAAGERDALATALTPVLDRYPARFTDVRWNSGSPLVCLGNAMRIASGAVPQDEIQQHLHNAVEVARHEGRRGGLGSKLSPRPDGVLALRAAELAVRLGDPVTPRLVATPTRVNGSLDPATLLERLSRAEAEQWQPWPFDLEQALLRLPRGATPVEVTAGAGALVSPAGRRFAQWLASGGLPDPVSERFVQYADQNPPGGYTWDAPVSRRLVATLRPSRHDGLLLTRQLLTHEPVKRPKYMPRQFKDIPEVLAMVLPHHREVAAAWAVGEIASTADQGQRGSARLLPLLADGTGPVGPALAAALAYGFCAKHESDRAAAVDAFLTLAAGTESFAGAVGAVLGDLCSDSVVKLGRALTALTDAHRSGASAAVWELLAAALPPLLPTKVRGVPDLLELATQVAVTLGARTEIPGLADIAARPGSSRLTKEARRLRTTLVS